MTMAQQRLVGQKTLFSPEPADAEALVRAQARDVWLRSPVLAARFATLDRLLDDPWVGRCVWLAARVLAQRQVAKGGRAEWAKKVSSW